MGSVCAVRRRVQGTSKIQVILLVPPIRASASTAALCGAPGNIAPEIQSPAIPHRHPADICIAHAPLAFWLCPHSSTNSFPAASHPPLIEFRNAPPAQNRKFPEKFGSERVTSNTKSPCPERVEGSMPPHLHSKYLWAVRWPRRWRAAQGGKMQPQLRNVFVFLTSNCRERW